MKQLLAKLPESAADNLLMKPSNPAAEKGIVLLVIFLVALALRAIAIDVPINSDEGLWMYRGTFFARRLMDGELAETYLRHHPGVTNMWLIGSSMFLNCLWHNWHPQFWGIDQPASVGACLNQLNFPIGMWILPRIFQAVVTAGCMVAIYDLVRRLLGRPVALVAIGLLMLEPFFLAYQRYLTTDAMQADFGTVGLLAMLVYLRQPLGDANDPQNPQIGSRSRRPRKWLLLSGAMMGLSIMSKIPSIFFIPAVVTWLVMTEVGRSESFVRRGWLRQGLDFGLWLLAIGATAFLIWPALWVAPVDTVTQLIAGLQGESQRGAFFYLGQTTDAIGPSFYPLALLYRLTPVLLVGLAIWIFMAIKDMAIKDGVRRPGHAPTQMTLLP
ncbi:MAG: glycosyltransferase family 39 protein, partial [Phormidesmis sp.]